MLSLLKIMFYVRGARMKNSTKIRNAKAIHKQLTFTRKHLSVFILHSAWNKRIRNSSGDIARTVRKARRNAYIRFSF